MIGRTFRFCPLCASALAVREIETEDRPRVACTACDFIHYQNPTPAAGIVLVENNGILMVKRKFDPRMGMWTLPAGFVEGDEDAATCAVREAKEETNLEVEITGLLNVYSAYDDPRSAVVLILYHVRRVGGELACGDDASDARFFPVQALPSDIAFKAHQEALRDVLRQTGYA